MPTAGITVGSRVLDVAAGAGGQSVAAGRRVGPDGYVLATDISPAILEYAAKAAEDAGLASAVVYATADRNRFFSVPVSIVRRRAQLPPPAAGQPGPFSLGDPGVAAAALTAAGFRDVTVETVPCPLRMASSADCLRFEKESFGALHQMLAGLDPSEQDATWAEVGQALAEFDGPDGFVGPCDMLVVAGTRP